MAKNITLVIGDGGEYYTGKSYHVFQSLLNDLKQGKSSLICDVNDEYGILKNKEFKAINRTYKTTDISLSDLSNLDYSKPHIYRIKPTNLSLYDWRELVNKCLGIYKGYNLVLDDINRYTNTNKLINELSNYSERIENIFFIYQDMKRVFDFPFFENVNKIRLHRLTNGVSYCNKNNLIYKYKDLILSKEKLPKKWDEKYIEFNLNENV